MSTDLDRLQAQARADATAVIARAATYERQLDLIDEYLAQLPLGRLHAICTTLAEHDNHIAEIYDRIAELTLEVRGG